MEAMHEEDFFFFPAEGGKKMQKCRKAGAHTEVPGTFLCFFNLSLTLISPHRQRGSAHMQAFGERRRRRWGDGEEAGGGGVKKKKRAKRRRRREEDCKGWIQAPQAQHVSGVGRLSAGQGAHQHLPTVQQDPDPPSRHHVHLDPLRNPPPLSVYNPPSTPPPLFLNLFPLSLKLDCVHSCICAYLLFMCILCTHGLCRHVHEA